MQREENKNQKEKKTTKKNNRSEDAKVEETKGNMTNVRLKMLN